MNIAVIGANGRSGAIFVEAALAAGHTVQAGVHTSHDLVAHPNLMIRNCNATDGNEVRELLRGVDVVVSLIGHVKGSPHNLQDKATEALINAMRSLQLTRVVSLVGSGVRMPGDKVTFMDRFFTLGIIIIDPWRIRDGKSHTALLMNSKLNWTVLRVVRLTTKPPTAYTLTDHGPAKSFVSRREVASAILTILADDSFIGKVPLISR